MLGWSGSFGSDQLNVERVCDPAGKFVLESEQIARVAVEPLCPKVCIGRGIDQLSADTELAAPSSDAPFQHIAYAELAADLPRIDGLVPVRERGIS